MITSDEREALLNRLATLPSGRREALRRTLTARGPEQAGPLSFAQERFWLLHRLDPAESSYHIAHTVRLSGPADAGAIASALTVIAARHEPLRTAFRLDGDGPVQVVLPARAVPLEILEPGDDVDATLVAFTNRPFDLETGPAFRAALIDLDDELVLLCVVLHHLVADGVSLDLFMLELAECYTALRAGREPCLPALAEPYSHFVTGERLRAERTGQAHLAYWTERLAGAPALDLPADRPRPARWTGRGGREPVRIPAAAAESLLRAAAGKRCTPFMALLAIFQVALGQDGAGVGVAYQGAGRTQFGSLIGCFANTLVLRAELSGDPTFGDLLGRTRGALLRALQHAETPIEHVAAALRPARDPSRTPIFQALLNLRCASEDDPHPTSMGELAVAVHPAPPIGRTKVEVGLELWPVADGFVGYLEYSSDLFTQESMRRFARELAELADTAGSDPGLRLSELRGRGRS